MEDKTNIRPCSYDPAADIIFVGDENGEKTEEYYLEVKYREHWFQRYCLENGIHGVVDAGELTVEPYNEKYCAVKSVAVISMDDRVVSKMAASKFVPVGDSDGIQTTVTLAIGRALKEAGFGTLSVRRSEDGAPVQVDAGVKVAKEPQKAENGPAQANPLLGVSETTMPEVKSEAPNTLKEAFNFIVPIGGYKGKTVSEVMAVEPGRIAWFASDSFNPDKCSGAEMQKLRRNFKLACSMVTAQSAS